MRRRPVPLERPGTELLTGEPATGLLAVPGNTVRVVRLDGRPVG